MDKFQVIFCFVCSINDSNHIINIKYFYCLLNSVSSQSKELSSNKCVDRVGKLTQQNSFRRFPATSNLCPDNENAYDDIYECIEPNADCENEKEHSKQIFYSSSN